MDWEIAVDNWPQFRDRVKGRWNQLTAEQLAAIAGDRQQLLIAIQEAYGIGIDVAEKQIQQFEARNKNYQLSTSTTSKWRSLAKETNG